MFSIFNKKESFRLGEILEVDMHSHILPGIDDGAPDGLIDGGYYGKREQEITFRLLDAGLIDFIGSEL